MLELFDVFVIYCFGAVTGALITLLAIVYWGKKLNEKDNAG